MHAKSSEIEINLRDSKIKRPTKELTIHMDEPPGYSPGRYFMPLTDIPLFKQTIPNFKNDMRNKIPKLDIGGQLSGAYTGEGYVVLAFVIGGIAGGFLNAIGKDIWNSMKHVTAKIFQGLKTPHNILEIAIEFQNIDVILHCESRKPSDISNMLDEANSTLESLNDFLISNKSMLKGMKSIELHRKNSKNYEAIIYSYRRAKRIRSALK